MFSLSSFNDRIRDSAMGGSPFGDPLQQGFLTGLLLEVTNVSSQAVSPMFRCLMRRDSRVTRY